MDVCSLCQCSLKSASQRRKLHGGSLKHVVSILQELVGELWIPATETFFHPEAFLCRPCVRNLEKLCKSKEDLRDKEGEIRQLIDRAIDAHGLVRESFSTLVRKRSAAADDRDSPTSKVKRKCYDTPTRNSLDKILPTGESPAVAVLVKGKKRARAHAIPKSSGLKRLARGLARRSRTSIGLQAVRHPRIRKKVLAVITNDIQKEMTKLCAKKTCSLLRQSSVTAISKFSWEALAEELERVSPTLYTILKGCISAKRRQRNSPDATQQQKHPSDTATLGVCACILLRHKNVHMNTFQHIISLVLHSGHSAKQVYRRLQKLLLCLSHYRTLTYLDRVGAKHDAAVLQWRANIEDSMKATNGSTTNIDTASQMDSGVQQRVIQSALPLSVAPSGPTESDDSSTTESPHLSSSQEHTASESDTSSSMLSEHTESSTSSDTDAFIQPVTTSPPAVLMSYKLVGDNIDKEVRPRDMRSDYQTRSLHYFHTYAVRDRVDLTEVSDAKKVPDVKAIQLQELLPTSNDTKELRKNFSILIARTLKKHMPFFKKFGKGVERHIEHQFQKQMSQKSEVVPLGIELKSEQKLEDMVDILASLHKYIPTVTTTKTVTLPEETSEITCDDFFQIPLGGDQMTSARVRGSQRIRSNSERGVDRLQGVVPVTEDWHAKMCFLEVIWKRLYTRSSGMDGGTLFQLRNLINRRNVVSDPSKDMNACEAFFLLVVESHVLAAAMMVFQMSSVDDQPGDRTLFPAASSHLEPDQRRKVLLLAVEKVLDKFVDLSFGASEGTYSGQSVEVDRVQAYACDVLSLGLLYQEFTDAIREGDGSRILGCWKFFLLIFKASNRTNYSIEAFNLLVQEKFLYSPRLAMQLKWSRTVNTHGRAGKNIPCDLHMEHLNRECKNGLRGLGSNITDMSVKRVGKCIGKTMAMLKGFDQVNGIPKESDYHTHRSSKEDMKKLLTQLTKTCQVYATQSGRSHRNFPNFSSNIMLKVSMPDLKQWMSERLQKLLMYM